MIKAWGIAQHGFTLQWSYQPFATSSHASLLLSLSYIIAICMHAHTHTHPQRERTVLPGKDDTWLPKLGCRLLTWLTIFAFFRSTAQLLSVSLRRRRQTSPLTQMHNYIRVRGSRTVFDQKEKNVVPLCVGRSFPSCFQHSRPQQACIIPISSLLCVIPLVSWSVNQMNSTDHLNIMHLALLVHAA